MAMVHAKSKVPMATMVLLALLLASFCVEPASAGYAWGKRLSKGAAAPQEESMSADMETACLLGVLSTNVRSNQMEA